MRNGTLLLVIITVASAYLLSARAEGLATRTEKFATAAKHGHQPTSQNPDQTETLQRLQVADIRYPSPRIPRAFAPTPLSPNAEKQLKAGDTFRECAKCPEMVVLPRNPLVTTGKISPAKSQVDHPHKSPNNRIAISKYEVTFNDWNHCVTHHNCRGIPNNSGIQRTNLPVNEVSWLDIKNFLEWLNNITSQSYRLPSEAEWEFAARATTTTDYSFGNDPAQLSQFAWYADNSQGRSHPVGTKKPNPFGLHDMHGNVWELTSSCHSKTNGTEAQDITYSQDDCALRIRRGGSWFSNARLLRSFERLPIRPNSRTDDLGFRVCRQLRD